MSGLRDPRPPQWPTHDRQCDAMINSQPGLACRNRARRPVCVNARRPQQGTAIDAGPSRFSRLGSSHVPPADRFSTRPRTVRPVGTDRRKRPLTSSDHHGAFEGTSGRLGRLDRRSRSSSIGREPSLSIGGPAAQICLSSLVSLLGPPVLLVPVSGPLLFLGPFAFCIRLVINVKYGCTVWL